MLEQVGPSEKALQAMGSLSTVDVVDNHQYWRLLTSIFLCPGVPNCAVMLPIIHRTCCFISNKRAALYSIVAQRPTVV